MVATVVDKATTVAVSNSKILNGVNKLNLGRLNSDSNSQIHNLDKDSLLDNSDSKLSRPNSLDSSNNLGVHKLLTSANIKIRTKEVAIVVAVEEAVAGAEAATKAVAEVATKDKALAVPWDIQTRV